MAMPSKEKFESLQMALKAAEEVIKKRNDEFAGSKFWLRFKLEEEPAVGKTNIFLLWSDDEKLPWKWGEDGYFRHSYGEGSSFRSIVCGKDSGIQCPVCDLVEKYKGLGLYDGAKNIERKAAILALVLDMDEVDGVVPVNIFEGEPEWVHAVEFKWSMMQKLRRLIEEDMLICSYHKGAVIEISGSYPKGLRKRAIYEIDLGKKGREFKEVKLTDDLISTVERKLEGNKLINRLIKPFYSPLEVYEMLSDEDRKLLSNIEYSDKRYEEE